MVFSPESGEEATFLGVSEYTTPGLLRWRSVTDVPLLIIAIASLPLLLLEVGRSELTTVDRAFLGLVNIVVLVAFAIDYIVRSFGPLSLSTSRAASSTLTLKRV